MSKKTENPKFYVRVEKSRKPKLASIISHIFETVWAVGAGAAAAMVISTSTHLVGRHERPTAGSHTNLAPTFRARVASSLPKNFLTAFCQIALFRMYLETWDAEPRA